MSFLIDRSVSRGGQSSSTVVRRIIAVGLHDDIIWSAGKTIPFNDGTVATGGMDEEPGTPVSTRTATSDGRGLGLFAVESIAAFSLILIDDALLSLAVGEDLPQLWERYLLLSTDQRASFDSLSVSFNAVQKEKIMAEKLRNRGYNETDSLKMAAVSSRFQANAFKTEGRWAHSLFASVARINHSCTPNAHAHHRPPSSTQHVYALKDISAGQEIEISYFDLTMPKDRRQARTLSWGFTCQCPACAGTLNAQYEQTLACIRNAIALNTRRAESLASEDIHRLTVDEIKRAIDLARGKNYPWLVAALPRLHYNLAVTLKRGILKDDIFLIEASRQALEEAWACECSLTGSGSPSSISAARRIKLKSVQ